MKRMLSILALATTTLLLNPTAFAANASDPTLYSNIDVTDSFIYDFDLGNVDEAGTSSFDIRLGGWNGTVPPNGPYVAGDVLVNGVVIGTFEIDAAYFDTTNPTASYDSTGFLQDGINTFEFAPNFAAPDYRQYAISDFYLTFEVAPVPLPAAAWLFGSALFGLAGVARRKRAAVQ